MDREYWIDGFNFFHHWESTKGLLRNDSGLDIVRAIERSVKIIAKHLGRKGRWSVVYLDGGLSRHETRQVGLRLRYAGPGRKADDRLTYDLADLGGDAKLVTVVTNDRELKANCRAHGAACLGVGEFLSILEGKKQPQPTGKKKDAGKPRADDASILREKTRTLSAAEVKAWLDYFGGDVEAE
ncbi:MAG: NYN domain-containing protein [Planctomycetes bacterium]|nr:NYN domain-containing protein [Planctomycetota bacterium]